MRVTINLASAPFRRDRPMLVASGAVALLLLGSLIFLVSIAVSERQQSAETRSALRAANRQLSTLLGADAQLQSRMRQPGNAVALDRSVLINTLIERKAISWTRIFADMDKVLPPDVRLLAIRPEVTSRDQVYLDLTVASQSPEPVIGFLEKLESSNVFSDVAASTGSPPTQTDPFYRYRITVNYAQKL